MLIQLSKYSLILPLFGFVWSWHFVSKTSESFRAFGSLIIFYILFEIITPRPYWFGFTSNLPLLTPYVLGEYLLLSSIFTKFTPEHKKPLVIGGVVLVAVVITERMIGNEWLSIARVTEGIILIIAAGSWFRKSYSLGERKLERLSAFWLSCAVLAYFVLTLPIFLNDANVYNLNKHWLVLLYQVKNGVNILNKILLTLAIIKCK